MLKGGFRVHWRRLHAAPIQGGLIYASAEVSSVHNPSKSGLDAVEKASKSLKNRVLSSLTQHIEHKDALALRTEAFYKRHQFAILAAVGSGAPLLLWQLSEGSLGLLAIAVSSVVCGGLALKTRYTINPEAVYGIVLRKLEESPALLEVMGTPIAGNKVRAYITSGGILKLKDFRPKLSPNRCFLMFPVDGYERPGMVTSEIVKDKGQYHIKFLAVDVHVYGNDERFLVVGKECSFDPLLDELKAPTLKALAAKQELDGLDEIEAQEQGALRKARFEKFMGLLNRSCQWVWHQISRTQPNVKK